MKSVFLSLIERNYNLNFTLMIIPSEYIDNEMTKINSPQKLML